VSIGHLVRFYSTPFVFLTVALTGTVGKLFKIIRLAVIMYGRFPPSLPQSLTNWANARFKNCNK
jgi:hypothetical protein